MRNCLKSEKSAIYGEPALVFASSKVLNVFEIISNVAAQSVGHVEVTTRTHIIYCTILPFLAD